MFTPELKRMGLDYLVAMSPEMLAAAIINEHYSYIYNYANKKYNFDNEVFKEILYAVKMLYDNGLLWDLNNYSEVTLGSNAGLFKLSPFRDIMVDDYKKFELQSIGEYFPLPYINGSEGIAISIRDEFAISAKAPNKNAAWEFVKIMLSEDVQGNPFVQYQSVLSSLSRDTVEKILKPWAWSRNIISNEEIARYNNERFEYFSKIDRVYGANGAPDVMALIIKHAVRFFTDENPIDIIINDLQNEVDYLLGER